MQSDQNCSQLTSKLRSIQKKGADFDELIQPNAKPNIKSALSLQSEISQEIKEIIDQLWPFEKLPKAEVERQYDFQIQVLRKRNILENINGAEGIYAIDGNFYPIPTKEQIINKLKEKSETLGLKINQGFTLPLLVPFGMKLRSFADKVSDTILDHHNQGKLFATKLNESDPDEPLELYAKQHLYLYDDDFDTKASYNPINLDTDPKKNKGKTKKEKIKDSDFPGWQFLLLEPLPNLPRGGNVETINGRTQLDNTGKSIKQYIKKGETIPSIEELHKVTQSDPMYQGEQGMIYESWLSYFLYHLEETNQVIDDYQGNGKISYLTGAIADGIVPCAYWFRGDRQAYLVRFDPGDRVVGCAMRLSVGVF
ncbi:MAG: hypothetical protein NTW50_03095 [Candidatus Berkelbacteria bacterium]|nr:hypothetical protein [Candidatus Berkelbacteria bacterium]